MKRVGVTGASGFIGQAVVAPLAQRGDYVRAFVRNDTAVQFPAGVDVRRMDLAAAPIADIASATSGLDAIVHLAGESVAGHWSEEKKRLIHDSRELTTRNLVTAMWQSTQRPTVLVCASASGYYGSRGDEPLSEDEAPGDDFLARVCVDWEREAEVAQEFGTRVVRLRQGLVLGRGGGALEAMLPPFRAGIGGPLGSGRQWWPWIHIQDVVELYLFALDREDIDGALNAVAPDPATNARFSQALGYALRRPALIPAPSIALRIALGEFADTLLSSQLLLPARAQDFGFRWKFQSLERALLSLLDPHGNRIPRTYRLETSTEVASPPQAAFEVLSAPGSLAALAPPQLEFALQPPQPVSLSRGSVIEYSVRVRGWRRRWKSLVTSWQPPEMFEDVQLRGPFLFWKHRHDFLSANGGTAVSESVEWALGFAPLSDMALRAVRADLQRTFDYRSKQIAKLLG